MALKGKLNRLKKHITKAEEYMEKQDSTHLSPEDITSTIDVPFNDDWKVMKAKPYYFDDHYSIIREKTYPINFQHGLHRFSELFEVMDMWEDKGVQHPLTFSNGTSSDMIFFDTETTGLGGGVGNTIFLIGYARVYKDYVTVKQHFLPNPSSEVALYQGFLTDIKNYETMRLTTYNGKAFDWPQIKTRHTLIRDEVPKLPTFGHFDLLHASRRLWKNKLPSIRLSIVEKEILDIKREGDVPGALAPLLYFDFLKDSTPKVMQGVLTHNEIDVLSLISLYIHISKKILHDTSLKISIEESYEIARWFESIGNINMAIILYEQLTLGKQIVSKKAQKALALIYKKKKEYHYATELLEKLLSNESMIDVEVTTELSKMYEHQWRDFEKALYYANLGYETWSAQRKLLRKSGQEKLQFTKRIERLKSKCQLQ
ncbi:ribonuclease H-like domain-containing protein [Bacillus sp. Marseille-P3661]|uniref:ribonuclease H-like domain-containing protein n=1 Tax=Bacillus sp. Marseille-P3661 TaxID=1936234 RepID=UPI0015E1891E|nr:ribonuclease H-like domain-containing protein [Bacillus sp. Marseille-P3661]